MRILHTIPSLNARDGGPPEALKRMVRALNEIGVETEIATTTHGLDLPASASTGDLINHEGVPVRFFPQVTWLRKYGFSTECRRWLKQNARNYDIIHTHAVLSPFSSVAMGCARKQGVPYLIRPLGVLSPWSLTQGKWKKRLFVRLIDRANLARAAAIHCTSEKEALDVEALHLGPKARVIPHGVTVPIECAQATDKLRAMVGAGPSDRLIVFIGRLHPKKGLDLLLTALAKCGRSDFKLVLAGEGDSAFVESLKQLAATLNLSDKLHLIGFVSGDAKDVLLQGADLFALTSHHENFALAALEALAAGTPVLLSNNVDLAPVVVSNKLGWVSTLELESITSCLKEFFRSGMPDADFPVRARNLVEQQYSWTHQARQLESLYRSILSA